MGFDLLNIEPHKISRDLSGYITYIYGAPKVGKTSLAVQAPDCLLLAFERGYNAISGVRAVDIASWGDMKKVFKELKKPEVRAAYKTLIVDTVDLAAKYCSKFICSLNDVQELGDITYGKGYSLMRNEFEEIFNSLAQMDYAIIFIGHDETKTITPPVGCGEPYDTIVPALSPDKVRAIIANMADIYGYAHTPKSVDGSHQPAILTIRDNTKIITCGSHFPYMKDEIVFSYQSLVDEINRAIDEDEAHGAEVIDKAPAVVYEEKNFAELKEQFDSLVEKVSSNVSEEDWENVWGPKIASIVSQCLGNKKVADLNESQVDQMDLVVSMLLDEIGNGI